MNIKVSEILEKLNLEELTGFDTTQLDSNAVKDVYICDLLSWVMGRAPQNSAWITIQGHINIIAVALLAEISCIIIAENAEVEPATINKAKEEGIPILRTGKPAFEIAVELASMK